MSMTIIMSDSYASAADITMNYWTWSLNEDNKESRFSIPMT